MFIRARFTVLVNKLEICAAMHIEQETTIKCNLLCLKNHKILKKQNHLTEVGPLCCFLFLIFLLTAQFTQLQLLYLVGLELVYLGR